MTLFTYVGIRWLVITSLFNNNKPKKNNSSRPVFIRIPFVENLKMLIEKIGNKNIYCKLGFLKDGMSDSQILEKNSEPPH